MTITQLKNELQITWKALAAIIGCSERTIMRYANGTEVPQVTKNFIMEKWKIVID